MNLLFNTSKIVMLIVSTALLGISSACIKVASKSIYPLSDCYWAEDVENGTVFIGIVKIDSIKPMHSDDDTDYQHYTYIVHYSNTKSMFNNIDIRGVFIYQSLSICGPRVDIELNTGSEYLVSLSQVHKIPYSEIYIGESRKFIVSHDSIWILNRYDNKEKFEIIKETITNSKNICVKIENKSNQIKPTYLDELD